jgi:hypothetical protein
MKRLGQVIAIALPGLLASGHAVAEGNGPVKSLCAITSTLTCDVTGCVRGPANAVNLPVFVKVDTKNKVVETAKEGGDRRTSKILSSHAEGDTLVLLGGELGHGWSATMDQATGSFTGTVAGDGIGYMIFGSCLAH